MVKFGLSLPNCGEGLIYPPPFADQADLMRLGREGEGLGFFSLWANDHVTTQDYVRRSFPNPPNYFEPLITLTFLAAQTHRAKLATGIIVLPLRDPIILGKQVAALDLLSGGRLILGVGLGAYREEFQRMFPRIPPKDRPVLLEESIQALRLLLSEKVATFEGRYIRFKEIELSPKPMQPRVPIYIGGNSEEGLRRVVKWGDGWFPAMQSPDEVAASIAKLRELCSEFGRALSQIDIVPELTVCMAESKAKAMSNFRESFLFQHVMSLQHSTLKNLEGRYEGRMLVGSADEIINSIQQYIDAGVTHFGSLIFPARTVDQFSSSVKEFARTVIPSFA